MADDSDGDIFVGSHEKAKNGYGQNGYDGPSSDLPGQATRTDREYTLPADPSPKPGDWQTRPVSAEPYATHPGMKAPAEPAKVPQSNFHRAVQRTSAKSFQRR